MCGILGFQVKPGEDMSLYDRTVMVHTLAKDMQSRGRDSFGGAVFPTEEKGKIRILKGLGPITESLRTPEFLRAAAESSKFLGHTRAATVGEVSIPNAHPFLVGNVLGVHNGHITNYEELNKKYKRPCEVDSQQFFYQMNEGRDLKELNGVGVFFWSKMNEDWKKIYFAKTPTGQIHIAKLFRRQDADVTDPDYFCTVWASNYDTLQKIEKLLGYKACPYYIESNIICYVGEDGRVFKTDAPFYLDGPIHHGSRSRFSDSDPIAEEYGLQSMYTGPMGPFSLTGEKNLTKHERATLRKQKQREKRNRTQYREKNADWLKDPTVENLAVDCRLPRSYMKVGPGIGEPKYFCENCRCNMEVHQFGWCKNSIKQWCKSKINECCPRPAGISFCNDCGHALLSPIHRVDKQYGILYCAQCNEHCAPEWMLVNDKEDKDVLDANAHEDVLEAEIVEEPTDEKPTEIVIERSAEPNLKAYIDKYKKDRAEEKAKKDAAIL